MQHLNFRGVHHEEEDEDGASNITATYDSLYTNVFAGCTQAGNCHTTGAVPEDGPDFGGGKDDFYTKVVGVKSSAYDWDTGTCGEAELIKKSAANESLLAGSIVESVKNSFAVSGCTPATSNHTQANVFISGDAATALVAWINAGASK